MDLPAVFGAMADPTRLELIRLLVSGPKTATQLFTRLAISQPRASRHLRILREAGLVRATRRGRWVHFELAPEADVVRLVALVTGREPAETAPARLAGASHSAALPLPSPGPRSPESSTGTPGTAGDGRPDPARGRVAAGEIEEFLL